MKPVKPYEYASQLPRKKETVWMKPTAASPACRFVFGPKTRNAYSACRIWYSPYNPYEVVTERSKVERCKLCMTGKSVAGDTPAPTVKPERPKGIR